MLYSYFIEEERWLFLILIFGGGDYMYYVFELLKKVVIVYIYIFLFIN